MKYICLHTVNISNVKLIKRMHTEFCISDGTINTFDRMYHSIIIPPLLKTFQLHLDQVALENDLFLHHFRLEF